MSRFYYLLFLMNFISAPIFCQPNELLIKSESVYAFQDSTSFKSRSINNLKNHLLYINKFNLNGEEVERRYYNSNSRYHTYEYTPEIRVGKTFFENGSLHRAQTDSLINGRHYKIREVAFPNDNVTDHPELNYTTHWKIDYDEQANITLKVTTKKYENRIDTTIFRKYLYSITGSEKEKRLDIVNLTGDTTYTKIENIDETSSFRTVKAVDYINNYIDDNRYELFKDSISDFYFNSHKISLEDGDTIQVHYSETIVLDSLNQVKSIIFFKDSSKKLTKILSHIYLGMAIKSIRSNYWNNKWDLDTVIDIKLDENDKEHIKYRTRYYEGTPISTEITMKEYEYY